MKPRLTNTVDEANEGIGLKKYNPLMRQIADSGIKKHLSFGRIRHMESQAYGIDCTSGPGKRELPTCVPGEAGICHISSSGFYLQKATRLNCWKWK